jgi:hypothetical protein
MGEKKKLAHLPKATYLSSIGRKIYAYQHLYIFKASYLSHLSIQRKFAHSSSTIGTDPTSDYMHIKTRIMVPQFFIEGN